MPIKIEITIEEKPYVPGTTAVDSHFVASGHATVREKFLHDMIAESFRLIMQHEGGARLGMTMIERGKI